MNGLLFPVLNASFMGSTTNSIDSPTKRSERSNIRLSHKQQIDIAQIDKILSSPQLLQTIPNFVNGRQTASNVNLIKTSLVIITRGFMDFKQLHEIMVAYETKCKDISNETPPLNFDIIQSSLRPIGLAIIKIIFQIWSKKCWQFLDCAQIEL